MARLDDLCTPARAWWSAFRDDAAPREGAHQRHVETCPECRDWVARVDRLSRAVRVAGVDAPGDLGGPARAAWAAQAATVGARRERRVARALLLLAGLGGLALCGIGLFLAPGYLDQAGRHLGWELYAFEAALSIGFLLSAHRPERWSPGLLPVTLIVAVLTVLPVLSDGGERALLLELPHLTLLLGAAGLLLLRDAAAQGRSRLRARSRTA